MIGGLPIGTHHHERVGAHDIHYDGDTRHTHPTLLTTTTVRGSGHDMCGVKTLVVRDAGYPVIVSIYRPKARTQREGHIVCSRGELS